MHKNILLAFGITILFLGVGFQPVLAREETMTTTSNSDEEWFTINGPTEGFYGIYYNYTFYLSPDSECDVYELSIHWGQGFGLTFGPYHSGENITLSYAWGRYPLDPNPKKFVIRAYAECNITGYSARLEVTMWKRGKTIPNIRFLERFILLEQLVNLLREKDRI